MGAAEKLAAEELKAKQAKLAAVRARFPSVSKLLALSRQEQDAEALVTRATSRPSASSAPRSSSRARPSRPPGASRSPARPPAAARHPAGAG